MNPIVLNEQQIVFLQLLERFNVNYLVIGGKAILAYCNHRETSDLDILVSRTNGNARKLALVFEANGWLNPRNESWTQTISRHSVKLTYPEEGALKQVDVLTSIDSIDFSDCCKRSISLDSYGLILKVPLISDLIAMKQVSLNSGNDKEAHEKDRLDIAELTQLL